MTTANTLVNDLVKSRLGVSKKTQTERNAFKPD